MGIIDPKSDLQEQHAGDNSTQVIIKEVNFSGITESQARDICKAECAIAIQNWAFQAGMISEARIQKLEDKVIPKMLEHDKQLTIFGDPSFQILLRKAQISAASTERESDYDVLADLLLHRAEQNDNRERRLGISKAIEIVDQLDEKALIGLSMVFAVAKFRPIAEDLETGLKILNDFYTKIINDTELPIGESWLEHLDLLSAIRIVPKGFSSFKKIEDFIPSQLNSFFQCGLKNDSEELKAIKEDFNRLHIPTTCFKPHPLKTDHTILQVSNNINNIIITQSSEGKITSWTPLSPDQKEIVQKAVNLMKKIDIKDQEMLSAFWIKWNSFDKLKKIHFWWNSLPTYFVITPIGQALANAYIHGKDSRAPYLI